MKIVFTGGGTGGHFYPIIAVAEAVHDVVAEKNLVKPKLYYIADRPYDEKLLYENDIQFRRARAGKVRTYFSFNNFSDFLKTLFGVPQALMQLFSIFPDVVFSKGSYASVPTVIAARILGIPIIIHDSDVVPGRANLFASKYATKIGIAYPQTAELFDKKYKHKIALIGNPIRKAIKNPSVQGAHEFFQFSHAVPTVLIMGGSQGAQPLNDAVLQALLILVEKFQIIHQTGSKNFDGVKGVADVALEDNVFAQHYKPIPYLNDLGMRMAVGACDLIVTRAGSGSIFEIAAWGKPAILVPLPEDISRDQVQNAFAYARSGAAVVLEQANLTPHVLFSEIDRLIADPTLRTAMSAAATKFQPAEDPARKIAEGLINIALKHEF